MCLPTDEDNSASGVGEINIRRVDLYLFADIEKVLSTLEALSITRYHFLPFVSEV
jgi:hypothetical protein